MDPSVAIGVAAALAVVFCLGLLVPRRPREVLSPVTDTKLDAIHIRMSELERKQIANDHDVNGIRMVIQHMPTIRSVHALELKVAELGGKVENLNTNIVSIANGIDRVEGFLIQATADKIVAGNTAEAQK